MNSESKKLGPKEVAEAFASLEIDEAIDVFAMIQENMNNSLAGEQERTEKRKHFLQDTRQRFFGK